MVASGILLSIPFSYPNLYFIAWLALLPGLYSLITESSSKAFLKGWIMGMSFLIGISYWLYHPLANFSGLSFPIILVLLLLLFAIFGLPYGIWAWIYIKLKDNNIIHPFLLAFSWVGVEFLRFKLIPFFAFGYLGYTQVNFKSLLQLAELGGILLISFIIILFNGYLFKFLRYKHKKSLICLLFLIIIIVSYGSYQYSNYQNENFNQIKVGIVQTRIPQENKWLPKNIEKNMNSMLKDRRDFKQNHLIITPETSLTFDLIRNEYYRDIFNKKLDLFDTYLQVGSQSIKKNQKGKFNSSFLISPEGEIIKRYNKNRLVVFGEYIPFNKLVNSLTNINLKSLESGQQIKLFKAPFADWKTAICSEILHPLLIQQKIDKVDFIVNQSNESWYRNSNLQRQMWAAAIMRAVENRRSVVKAGNFAYNGVVYPSGYSNRTDLTYVGGFSVLVKLSRKLTIYQKWGNYIGYISLIVVILIVIIKLLRKWFY